MKRYYMIGLTVAVFFIATGIGTALAGGSSDTSGDGYHCYLFFTLSDETFAQFMANASNKGEVVEKAIDAWVKYEGNEAGELKFMVCGTPDTACLSMPDSEFTGEVTECQSEVNELLDAVVTGISQESGKRVQEVRNQLDAIPDVRSE